MEALHAVFSRDIGVPHASPASTLSNVRRLLRRELVAASEDPYGGMDGELTEEMADWIHSVQDLSGEMDLDFDVRSVGDGWRVLQTYFDSHPLVLERPESDSEAIDLVRADLLEELGLPE